MARDTAREGQRGRGLPVEVHSPDFPVPSYLTSYLRGRLGTKLAKFGRRLGGVLVWLKDVNGPKGGEGIRCRMQAQVAGMEPVNVVERDHDVRAALDRASERLALGLQRHLGRVHSLALNRGRKMVRRQKLAT
jgi:putative sigma-54 modulation protein